MEKTLFLEHFFMISTFLHGSAYTSSENHLLFLIFVLFLLPNEKNIVEENSENDE